MSKQCTQCNSALNTQSKFCPNCGAAVPEEAAVHAQAQSDAPPPAQGGYTPPQGGYTPPPPAQGGYSPPAYSAPQAQKQKKPINPKLFLFGGIGVAAVLAIVLLVLLLGGGDKPAAADAAYLGVWEAASLVDQEGDTYTAQDLFDEGFTLELMEKGKCISDYDGDREILTWSVKGDFITIKEGSALFLKGAIKEGKIVAEDFPAADNTMTFVKQGYTIPAVSEPSGKPSRGGKADGGHAPETDAQAKWSGSWYGDMWVLEASGYYAQYDGDKFDAYMVLDIGENGEGTMAIFLGREEGKTVDAYIYADINHFEVTEGEFWDMPLDSGVWWLGLSPIDEGKLTVISDTYIDPERTPNDRFEFMFRFRPWGELWEQEEREGGRLPPGYADYKQAIESGVADPNA